MSIGRASSYPGNAWCLFFAIQFFACLQIIEAKDESMERVYIVNFVIVRSVLFAFLLQYVLRCQVHVAHGKLIQFLSSGQLVRIFKDILARRDPGYDNLFAWKR